MSDSGDSSDDSSEVSDEPESKPKKRPAEDAGAYQAKKPKAEINESEGCKNLFVGNLSWNVDEEWLAREFEEFGELTGTRIISDKNTGRSKG